MAHPALRTVCCALLCCWDQVVSDVFPNMLRLGASLPSLTFVEIASTAWDCTPLEAS